MSRSTLAFLCIKPCGQDTDFTFCPIIFKLHFHLDNERRYPTDFGSRGHRSRSTKFSVLKLIETKITPSRLALAYLGTFWVSLFNILNYFVWLRITDEGSVPEMRIRSILIIKSDLKWCIHLSRSNFLYWHGV